MLTDDDALVIDALQLAPRAPWSAVGEVLGISPTTAAKRWQRLVEEGVAWVTASPTMATSSPQCLAHVEVSCRAGAHFRVANAVALHPLAVTVELTTGPADLLVTLAGADLPTISHYVLHHLDAVDGVLNTQTSVATRLYSEGGLWRIRRLPERAVRALLASQADELAVDGELSQTTGPPSDTTKAITELLSTDGRMPYSEIAERLHLSPTTARRRTAELIRSGRIRLRTDVSAQDAGWPVENYVRADVPVPILRETAQRLSQMRQSRLTATVAAGPQLLQSSWLQTVEEVHRIELSMVEQHPQLQILERLLVLRVVKRNGRLIGPDGRATGVVPINIWDDALCDEAPVRAPSGRRPMDGPAARQVENSDPPRRLGAAAGHTRGMQTVGWRDARWLNAPAKVTTNGDHLVVEATEGSDFWRHTSYGFVHDSGHALLVDLPRDQAIEVSFVVSMSHLYDQAGLLLRVDERTWLKAGVEWSDGTPQMSVVATLDRSDWSMRAVPMWDKKTVTIRASLAQDTVVVRTRCDGAWSLERVAPFATGGRVLAGPMICAPTRAGLEIRFTRFAKGPADPVLHADPSPPGS